MRRIDTPDELFAPGDPATSTKGTTVRNWWLNIMQEELAGVIEGLGGTLDPVNNSQLFDWILASFAMKSGLATQIFRVATAVGASDATPLAQVQALIAEINALVIASTAEAQAMTDNTKALSPLRLKEALQGGNQSLVAAGYQKFPGGLIEQWGSVTTNSSGDVGWTFPIVFPNACLGVFASPKNTLSTYYVGTPTTGSVSIKTGTGTVAVNVRAIGY